MEMPLQRDLRPCVPLGTRRTGTVTAGIKFFFIIIIIIIINPILIRVYPRKRGWPDLLLL